MLLTLFPAGAPVARLIAAALSAAHSGRLPAWTKRACEALALLAVLVALGVLGRLVSGGSVSSPLLGFAGFGLSFRIDAVSAPLLLLITFLGWIVIRYTRTYLDGEAREGRFMGWLTAALACVMLMVTAGNLGQLVAAWIGTSIAVHQLLLFYPDRDRDDVPDGDPAQARDA